MAVDKLTPRYLNKDNDPRVLKSIELVDALNIRVSNNDDGNAGVVKNIKGNTVVAYKNTVDTLPAGTNKVIGHVSNLQKDEVFYFVYNSNNNHTIYKYSLASDRVIKVYQDSVLKFTENGFVKADIIVNQYNDTLLYFTDSVTSPKKINISKAESGLYPNEYSQGTDSLTTLTEEERLYFITAAKQPPLAPPTFNFFTDSSKTVNNLYEKTFQFAYQYVYDDGEVSAISPYSAVAFTAEQLNDGLITEDAKKTSNGINVEVKTHIGDVKKLRVLARSGSDDVFYVIDEIDNDRSSVHTKTIKFFNDGSYTAVTKDQFNKLFDNVPLKADTQAISNNRLMYGGYTEGYNNVDVDIDVLSNYKKRYPTYDTPMTLDTDNNSTAKTIEIDLSDFPGVLNPGSTYTLDLTVLSDYVKINMQNYPMSWQEAQKGTNVLRGRIDDTVNVDMTPIKRNFVYAPTHATTKQDAATAIMGYLSTNIDVSFDTINQFLDHATKITDVINGGVGDGNTRYAYYKGSGIVRLTNRSYNLTSEKITAEIKIIDAAFTIDRLYGQAGGAADFTDERFVSSTGYNGNAQEPATSINISYDGDGSTYTGYSLTLAGDPVKYFNPLYSTTENANSRFQNATLTNNSRYSEGGVGSLSFKAGANHSLGVVYYDDRNRSGSVQKAPETYVKWFGERGKKGPTSLVMRIKNAAPSWATRWSPVYAGNSTISNHIQYSVIEARYETNTTALKSAAQDYNNKIFVSFRSLAGKEDSYVESKGALLDYSFTKGDKLRVLSFGDNYYPNGVDFNVVGYEYFSASPTDNPIFDDTSEAAKYKTTGYYLILEDNGHSKFGKAAVVANTDDWDNKCVVEIYSKKKTTEGLPFYEIGKSYAVSNGVHSGERTATSVEFSLTGTGSFRKFYSDEKVFRGDTFTKSGVEIDIYNVELSDNTSYSYMGDCVVVQGDNGTHTMTVQNPDVVVELTDGDVYYRLRQLRHGKDHTSYNYLTEYIEDSSLSDFFGSNQQSYGRSNLYSPSTIQLYRKASITYSEPFNYDSQDLLLSSFNLSLANFDDFDNSYGSIKFLQNSADSLICIQQNKMSVIPVGRNIIQYASENADLVASNNILGTPQYMAGNYGCDDNPESVSIRFGRVYFSDIRSGKVLAFGASGIEPISEKNMDSFFSKKFADATKYTSAVDLNSGYDPDNDEYLVSINDIYNSSVVVTHSGGSTTAVLSTDSSGIITSSPVFGSEYLNYDNANIDWDDLFTNYNDAGNGVIYLDRNDIGNVQLDSALSENLSGSFNIVATTTTNDFIGQATVNLANGNVTLVNGEGVTYATSGTAKEFEGFTVAYDAKSGQWSTFYSFVPEKMGYIKNLFYTFKDGRLYTHDTNSTYNSFYGTSYPSKISVVSNFNPSMVKTYETISLEGNASWDAVFKNTDQQSSVSSSAYEERERNHYAHIGRDTLGSTGHIVSIGKVTAINGDKITIDSRISNIPIGYESDILKVSGSSLVDTNLDVNAITGRKELQADATVSGISVNDVLVARTQSAMDGDPMRDYYMQIDLEKTSNSAIELYAVNTTFDKSNLHDQQGQ